MLILDVGTEYDLCGLDCQKGKIYKYFKMSFSCFGPFGIWGMTSVLERHWKLEYNPRSSEQPLVVCLYGRTLQPSGSYPS